MADAQTTCAELKSLLCRIPGINVESIDALPSVLSMTLVIKKAKWIGPIVYCSMGANIPLSIWSIASQGNISQRANLAYLRFRLFSKTSDGGQEEALDQFTMFGCHLVWHLHEIELLTTADANRFLALWDGKRVGTKRKVHKTIKRTTMRKGAAT